MSADHVYNLRRFPRPAPRRSSPTHQHVRGPPMRGVARRPDGQGSAAENQGGLVEAITKVTPKADHDRGDRVRSRRTIRAGNASFPAGVRYIIHPDPRRRFWIARLDAVALRGSSGGPRAGRAAHGRRRPTGPSSVADKKKRSAWAARRSRSLLPSAASHTGGDSSPFLAARARRFLFPQRDLSETASFPRHANSAYSQRVAAGTRYRAEAMHAQHLHRRATAFTETGPGVAGKRSAAYHQALAAGDRGSDAALQGRRAGRSGDQRRRTGARYTTLDPRLRRRGPNRDPESVRRVGPGRLK